MQLRKRILVTGGAGFIGSHLCAQLLKNGHEVICVDNFFCSSKYNIAELRDNPDFEVIRHDITFPLYLEVDEIYNLACPSSPIYYQKDAVQTVKTCVHGAINMLGLAKRLNVPIFQASTSEIYGDPKEQPQKESYWGNVNPIGLRSCYEEGNRCAEALCFSYNRQHGLPVKVCRIFNTYGPNMHRNDGRVISNFIIQALRNEPLTIYGDGSQLRSFCYVGDLIDGMMRFMKTEKNITGPLNLGNPQTISIRDLAREIIDLCSSKSKIVNEPLPPDDPAKRCPDVSLAEKELNWHATTKLRDGLKNTISYFEKRLKKPSYIFSHLYAES